MEKTVLIAEDYADVRSMTRIMVETCGYSVVEAQDGYEALEAAKERRPDIILMDIAMPLMNGITSAGLIRTI
ncbi:MAG TPA: response regulator, partial [Pyrinomonadaceae bacterium]|nr:response regulator [Pyrinomonadaceae bacterium]